MDMEASASSPPRHHSANLSATLSFTESSAKSSLTRCQGTPWSTNCAMPPLVYGGVKTNPDTTEDSGKYVERYNSVKMNVVGFCSSRVWDNC